MTAGVKVEVEGSVTTSTDGERCISATQVTQSGFGSVEALAVNNRSVGGGSCGYQAAVWGWVPFKDDSGIVHYMWTDSVGLSNIGLLIKTWGTVAYAEPGFFYIDDGSRLNDNTGHRGIKVYGSVPAALGLSPVGKPVSVTGISSCERMGTDLIRAIRTRGAGDVVIVDEEQAGT